MRSDLLTALFVCSAAAAAASDSLDVKTGLWEVTYTTEVHGMMVPQSTLDKLTPEQRAKAVASMNARAAAGPKSRTHKTCVTAEDLSKGAFRSDSDKEENCQYTTVTRTSTVQEESIKCTGDGGRRGTFKVEAQSREHMTAELHQELSSGGATMQMTGKWLAADCPADTHD